MTLPVHERAVLARGVAFGGFFDFDNVGAQIAEYQRGVGPGKYPRKINNLYLTQLDRHGIVLVL